MKATPEGRGEAEFLWMELELSLGGRCLALWGFPYSWATSLLAVVFLEGASESEAALGDEDER